MRRLMVAAGLLVVAVAQAGAGWRRLARRVIPVAVVRPMGAVVAAADEVAPRVRRCRRAVWAPIR